MSDRVMVLEISAGLLFGCNSARAQVLAQFKGLRTQLSS
jgi:hypothetical protein